VRSLAGNDPVLIDLHMLFEPRPDLQKFKDLNAELTAIRSARKAMSVFSLPLSETDSDGHKELMQTAAGLGLSTIEHTEKLELDGTTADQLYVFVLNSGQAWRVPAYLATRKILRQHAWSDGAECLESFLLGYDDEEISSWIADIRSARVSWTGKTFYVLMTCKQRDGIAELGRRCIDQKSPVEDITAFFNRTRSVLKNNALDFVPRNMTIGRVSVAGSFFPRLFGRAEDWGDRDVISSPITQDLVALLNPALDSNFQFLGVDGWN